MVPKKVYISYSDVKEDVIFSNNLIIHVGLNNRLELWYSERVFAGDDFIQKEQEQFEQCDVFMPVLTVNYMNNEFCVKRLKEAIENGKNIIPLFARSFDLDAVRLLDQIKEKIILSIEKPLDRHEDLNIALSEVSSMIRERIFGEMRNKSRFFPKYNTKAYFWILASIIFLAASILLLYGFFMDIDKQFLFLGVVLILLPSLLAFTKILFPTNVINEK